MIEIKKFRKKSAIPAFSIGLTWLAWSLLFPLYTWANYAACAFASLFVYIFMRAVFPAKVRTEALPPPKPPEFKLTGEKPVDEVLSRGAGYIKTLYASDESIKDEEVSAGIVELCGTCADIFETLRDRPQKAGELRRFMDYYMPTAIKMLDTYKRLENNKTALSSPAPEDSLPGTELDMGGMGTSGRAVSAEDAKNSIKEALKMMNVAAKRELKNLLNDEILDVTTDIEVLESMLKRDGLR